MRFFISVCFSIVFMFSSLYSSDFLDDEFSDEFEETSVEQSFDPLKSYNVVMTDFNDFTYVNIIGPVAKGYRKVVAKPVRVSVSNFFYNLLFPVRFTNNLLQLKFNNTLEVTASFVINSTYGLAGFFDIAKSEGGIEHHDEDFGQTLGYYGMGNDIHIVLPLFGPSNLRDTIGLVGDMFVDPIYHAQRRDFNIFKNNGMYIFLNTYKIGNEYSLHVDEYEAIRKNSIDLYLLLKDMYEQRRDKLIKE